MKGNLIGRKIPEGCMTVATYAERMGVSKTTVYKWLREGKVIPRRQQFGKLSVAIFDQSNVVEALHDQEGDQK